MKRAKLTVQAVAVDCPYCGEPIAEPENGSLNWEPWQVEAGTERICISCKKVCTLPRVPGKVGA